MTAVIGLVGVLSMITKTQTTDWRVMSYFFDVIDKTKPVNNNDARNGLDV